MTLHGAARGNFQHPKRTMKPPTDHQPTPEHIVLAPREEITSSPLNPRKTFPEPYLGELGLNIRNNGLINALVVRPIAYLVEAPEITNSWHVKWRCHAAAPWRPLHTMTAQPEELVTRLPVSREEADALVAMLPKYELVAGECRWRATGERPHPEMPRLTMAAVSHLPIIVRELNDAVVLELMISENMKRRDLSPLEEMDAFARMLEQRDGDGQAVHTAKTLADKIGVSENYVRQRLSLRKLTAHGRKALAEGRISFFTARTLCNCPAAIIPLVEDEVLHPKKYDRWHEGDGPLTADETQEVIRSKYVRELRGAPFALTNASLVPVHENEAGERIEGGPCTDCPWNTANQPDEAAAEPNTGGKRGRGRPVGDSKFCLNPACYQKKVDIHVAAELVRAKDEGCRVLSDKEAEKAVNDNGSLTYQSPYVKLDEKPDATDRAHAVEEKKCPTWEKIVDGMAKPEVVIAVDRRGHVHRLVERKVALAAARKNGTEKYLSLTSGRGRSSQGADFDEQKKKDAAKAKLRGAQGKAVLEAMVNGFQRVCVNLHEVLDERFWRAMLPISVRHAGHAGCTLVSKHLSIEVPKNKSVSAAVEAYGETQTGVILAGFNFELLLAQDFSYADSPYNSGDVFPENTKALIKLFRIEPGTIKKQIEREAAEKKKVAKKGKAAAPAKKKPLSKEELASLGGLSAKLEGLRQSRGLSPAALDKVAKVACGRRPCDFAGAADYDATIAAVENLPVNNQGKAADTHDAGVGEPGLPPERQAEIAKIDAMHAAGKEITVVKVQSELKLRGTTHAKWLVNQWKKLRAATATPDAPLPLVDLAKKSIAVGKITKSLKPKKETEKKRHGRMTPADRAKLAAKMKARWAARKKGLSASEAKI